MKSRWNVGEVSYQMPVISCQLKTKSYKQRFVIIFSSLALLLALLTGCGTIGGTPTPIPLPPVMPKILATVYISPTPDEQQVQATRAAQPPTVTAQPLAPTVLPTAYVGVFLGEAQAQDDGGPVISESDQFAVFATPVVVATVDLGCPAQADAIFNSQWQSDAQLTAALGCPIELVGTFQGQVQVFERGVMYGRPGGEVWGIAPASEKYWYYPVALPPPPNTVVPPSGLLVPSEAFFAVWQAAQGLSDAIGFARIESQEATISTQRFQGGVLLGDGSSGQTFVLLANGTAHGPY